MDFTEAMMNLTELIEAFGVAIIVLGGTYGLLRAFQDREAGVPSMPWRRPRCERSAASDADASQG